MRPGSRNYHYPQETKCTKPITMISIISTIKYEITDDLIGWKPGEKEFFGAKPLADLFSTVLTTTMIVRNAAHKFRRIF